MSVFDLKPLQQGQIHDLRARGALRQRLLDMGLLPHSAIRVERVAPGGEPVWIRVGASQIALRRDEAEAILVLPSEHGLAR